MLKRHDGEITAYVDGLSGSIASVIIMPANKIYCPTNAFNMIHKACTWADGNATQRAVYGTSPLAFQRFKVLLFRH